jgi:hypothetical protein
VLIEGIRDRGDKTVVEIGGHAPAENTYPGSTLENETADEPGNPELPSEDSTDKVRIGQKTPTAKPG